MMELMSVSIHPNTILSVSVGVRLTMIFANAANPMSSSAQFSIMKSTMIFSIYLCVIWEKILYFRPCLPKGVYRPNNGE